MANQRIDQLSAAASAAAADLLFVGNPGTGELKKITKQNLFTSTYKSYAALMSQAGTDAPTAIILDNTLTGDITLSRQFAGTYSASLPGGFDPAKTLCFITANSVQSGNIAMVTAEVFDISGDMRVGFSTIDAAGNFVDGWAAPISIEIRVYP